MAHFSHTIGYEKPQGTNYKGPQGFLENFCAVDKINFLGSKRLIETNI